MSPVSDSPPVLRTPLRLHVALTSGTNRRNPGTFQKQWSFGDRGELRRRVISLFFVFLELLDIGTHWGRQVPRRPRAWWGGGLWVENVFYGIFAVVHFLLRESGILTQTVLNYLPA